MFWKTKKSLAFFMVLLIKTLDFKLWFQKLKCTIYSYIFIQLEKISFSNFIHFFPHVKKYRITVFFSVRVCISNCVGWIKTERNRLQVIKGEKRHGAEITLFTVYQCDLRNLVIWLKNSFQSFLPLLQIKRKATVLNQKENVEEN